MSRLKKPPSVSALLRLLDKRWPAATTELTHRDPWQLLVATILSAQCTDARVNLVTPGFFKRWPAIADVASARLPDIQKEIHSTGFYRNKAKSIQGAARRVLEAHAGRVPRTMAEMLEIPGVARKTANVVLGTAFGIAEGVVVDTHIHRLSRRLGLTKEDRPEKIEQDLMRLVPKARWILFGHQLVLHGRHVCQAKKPLCPDCSLRPLCPSAQLFLHKPDPKPGDEKK
ncbi:MAG: endonuclease III [Planctomycetota bacterium]